MSQTTQRNHNSSTATDTHAATETTHTPRSNDSSPQANAATSGNLADSPTMAHLLDALKHKTDVGHYGQFTFITVARHFMDEDEIVNLIAKQPNMDEHKARGLYQQVTERNYNPAIRQRLIEQQHGQDFQIVDPNDPDSGNLYRELQFPDGIYEDISHYHEEKAEA